MFSDNLVQLRKILQMTQEDIAEKVGGQGADRNSCQGQKNV